MSETPDGFMVWRRFSVPYSGNGLPMRFLRINVGTRIILSPTATIEVGDPVG